MRRKSSVLALECVALVALAWGLELESPTFPLMAALYSSGALLGWVVPQRFRVPLHVGVSALGIFILFKPAVVLILAVSILAIVLICISRLPHPFKISLAVSLIATLAFASSRLRAYEPLGIAAPLIGGAFVFRLISCLRNLKIDPSLAVWQTTAAYFMMLPGLGVGFFPVVDFKEFSRGQPSADLQGCRTRGLDWMHRGLVQLIAYRGVKQFLFIPFEAVISPGTLARHAFTNYLLYLHVSGVFHLVIGMLSLYGVELPETHHRYLFARSFTDYWRRINIYWTEFMTKVVFYPSYFAVRRVGHRAAVVLATAVVFAASWGLHSSQIYWMSGVFPVKATDLVFWGTLWVCVAANVLWDESARDRAKPASEPPAWIHFLQILGMLLVMTCLWALWSADGLGSFGSGLLLIRWSSDRDLAWLLIYPTIALLGVVSARGALGRSSQWQRAGQLSFLAVSVLALLLQVPVIRLSKNSPSSDARYLSTWDPAQTNGAFYEKLKPIRSRWPEAQAATSPAAEPWEEFVRSGVFVDDFRHFQFIPRVSITPGENRLGFNRWGMLDEDYPLERRVGVERVALLGSSYSLPYGIAPGHDWSQVAENTINAAAGARRIEIMNFGVIGYSPFVYPFVLTDQVARFHPDLVLIEGVEGIYRRTSEQISKAVQQDLKIPYPELYPILGVSGPGGYLAHHYYDIVPFEIVDSVVRWSLKRIAATCHEIGARPALLMLPFPGAPDSGLNDKLLAAARSAGIEIIDVRDSLNGHLTTDLLRPGDIHLTESGHKLLAIAVVRELTERLAPPPATLKRGKSAHRE